MRRFQQAVILTLIAGVIGSCSLMTLKRNIKEMSYFAKVSGTIKTEVATKNPILIAIIKEEPGVPQLVNYVVQQTPGDFVLFMEPGKYRLFVYEDTNRDKKYQSNERIVRSKLLDIASGMILENIKLTIPEKLDQELIAAIEAIKKNATIKLNNAKINIGKVVSIDEKYFSEENSAMGMWDPLRFIKEVPFGLFMLQEYDPDKIPVLFVHGTNGTPKDFKYLISQLDTEKFQPWVFYYPTSPRLNTVGRFLNRSVTELIVKYNIKEINVVGHSMGGLVSRSFINHTLKDGKTSVVKRFISISTPWHGDKRAKRGVDKSPVVMPVWKDLAPDSKFLAELFKEKLPAEIRYTLLFTYKGGSSGDGETNDGVVPLLSQLRLDAQEEAKLVRGFNENHSSVLKSKDVSDLINSILEEE
ncbi:alpha/beta hydrolase [bacterium]|nr:alpha/beta hydrolase [bacterium]